jgi:hypothetical protein
MIRPTFKVGHRGFLQAVTIGEHTIRPWYYSPYPTCYQQMQELFICQYCWKYFSSATILAIHSSMNRETRPLDREIYQDGSLSIFEMRGVEAKFRCQSFCLLGKLFIEHKVLCCAVTLKRFCFTSSVNGMKVDVIQWAFSCVKSRVMTCWSATLSFHSSRRAVTGSC